MTEIKVIKTQMETSELEKIPQIKSSVDGFNSRMEGIKARISELGDRVMEITQ